MADLFGFRGVYDPARTNLEMLTANSNLLPQNASLRRFRNWRHTVDEALTSSEHLLSRAQHPDAINRPRLAALVKGHVEKVEQGINAGIDKIKSNPNQEISEYIPRLLSRLKTLRIYADIFDPNGLVNSARESLKSLEQKGRLLTPGRIDERYQNWTGALREALSRAEKLVEGAKLPDTERLPGFATDHVDALLRQVERDGGALGINLVRGPLLRDHPDLIGRLARLVVNSRNGVLLTAAGAVGLGLTYLASGRSAEAKEQAQTPGKSLSDASRPFANWNAGSVTV